MEIFVIVVIVAFCLALQLVVTLLLQQHHFEHDRWLKAKADEMQRDLNKFKEWCNHERG